MSPPQQRKYTNIDLKKQLGFHRLLSAGQERFAFIPACWFLPHRSGLRGEEKDFLPG